MYGGKFAFQNRRSLIVGSKFIVFALQLFYFAFEGNFPSTSPGWAYIWRGDLTEGFLRYRFAGLIFGGREGLIHGGAYFRNFTASKMFVPILCSVLCFGMIRIRCW